jgi:uncharacterized membrane protein YdjX (TVP38/TMEM64 family)
MKQEEPARAAAGNGTALKGLFVFLALALAGLAVGYFTPLREVLDMDSIRQVADRLGSWGPAVLLLMGAVAPLLFLPRWPVCFLAGLLYGVVWGSLLANTAGVVGAGLHFLVARRLLADSSRRALNTYRLDPERIPADKAFLVIFLLRAFPLSNSAATNVLSGALKISWVSYLGATFLGMIPSTLMYASWGKLMKRPGPAFYYFAIALVGIIVLGGYLARRYLPELLFRTEGVPDHDK